MTARARQLRQLLAAPGLLAVTLLTVAALALFVIVPLVNAAFTPEADTWRALLGSRRWRTATGNTLWLTALSCFSAVTLGLLYALAVTRVRVPGWRLFSWVPLIGLFSPPFVGALAIILLFGRNGVITSGLLGLDVSLYGWHGVWFAQTLSFFPLAYLVLTGVLQRIPSSLEQAAAGYGASGAAVLRSVTLPLARPGILAATLFVSLSVLADFGTPMLLGGRFRVLATEAYNRVAGWGDLQTGTALGLVLLLPALVIYLLQHRAQAADRFATVGARVTFGAPLPVPASMRWGLFGLCLLVSAVLLAKLLAVVAGGLATTWAFDWTPTFEHYSWVLTRSGDVLHTLAVAPAAALLGTLVSLAAAFLVHAVRLPGRGLLDAATMLPAAVPGTLFGIAYVLSFNSPPLELAGTSTLIAVNMAFSSLPTAYRICAAALQQTRRSLTEAAGSAGAGWLHVFRDVTLPLLRGPAGSAALLAFIHGLGTLSAVIFLVAPGKNLASVSILNLAEEGYWGGAAAIATVLMVAGAAVLGAARLVLGRNFRPFGEI